MFVMKVNYKKLWKLLIDKEMKKTDLITVANTKINSFNLNADGEIYFDKDIFGKSIGSFSTWSGTVTA